MIKKILTVLMSLSLGATAREVSEERFYEIKDIKNISFEPSIEFPSGRMIRLSSMSSANHYLLRIY